MISLSRYSVNNPVMVGLATWTLVVGGVYSGVTLVREMFPEITPDRVVISTSYPGATPAEVEKGISIKIEEAIKDIEEIEEIRTTIGEGFSSITAALYSDVSDVDQVVNDIKAAIDAIPADDWPNEAEESQVFKLEPRIPVINVAYFGDLGDEQLKTMGRRLRDDLLAIPGITKVVLQGTRADEISVEVRPDRLVEYGLSLPVVADAIHRGNLDLPAGQIKSARANVSVRTLGEEQQAGPIGDIVIRSDPSGEVLRVRDVATVVDGFEDTDVSGRFNAKPAVICTVFKTSDQDAIDIAAKVKAFVAGKTGGRLERDWVGRLKASLGIHDALDEVYEHSRNSPYPAGGTFQTSTNLARFIEGRLDLLKRNGAWGLGFVFVSLLLFLNWRVALWVMNGLLLAVLGTIIVMKMLGLTLNLISMFGLIVVLGLLVDDAIIVGEHIFTRVERGEDPRLAAIEGTAAVTWPVTCAVLTTIVAFAPLLFIEGQIGQFMGVLPLIVMCALFVSLIEALSLLPSHLSEWLRPSMPAAGAASAGVLHRWSHRARALQSLVLKRLLLGGYRRLLRLAVSYRYVTMAVLVSVLIMTLGLIAGGRVPIVFVQKMDSETIMADVEMPVGTPMAQTDRAASLLEQEAVGFPELECMYAVFGVQYSEEGQQNGRGSHLGQLVLELTPIDERDRTSEDLLRDLRTEAAKIPGAKAIKFSAVHGGPGGKALQLEVSGDDLDQLVTVAIRLKHRLNDFAGVFDIDDDFDAGQRELQIELLDSASPLGITTESLATQVRGAFYGIEARKIPRDREDVKIMVRFPPEQRTSIADAESMWVAAADGTLVPFTEVASVHEGRAYATIKRTDQKRTVTITADVDEAVGNARQITAELESEFPRIRQEFPGITLRFTGQAREFAKSFGSLRRDFLIAAALIYVVLAGLFKSYVQPLVVMSAIPFGMIGAVAAHYVTGYPLTLLSIIGLVALSGIVVNDSLILVDWINRSIREGAEPTDAVIDGGCARMRAIMLTSITTILGLAPLLLETSFQARFLIPMGLSVAGGVAFATVLTLVAIPALYLIVLDFKAMGAGVVSWFRLSPSPS